MKPEHSTEEVFDAVMRGSLAAFTAKCFNTVVPADVYAPNWHIEVIADRLERCSRGEIRRLVITVPPRSLKSICASVAFPAWLMGRDPSVRIIAASYSSELSRVFARQTREVMHADWYRRAFPGVILKRNAEVDLQTTRNGIRFATSVDGTLTGRGGKFILIDDPLKPRDADSSASRDRVKSWYDGTVYSRLDNKTDGVIILIQQRLHVDDLVAHVMEKEGWVHLNLAAIANRDEVFELSDGRVLKRARGEPLQPEREPLETLETIRRTVGSFNFSAQYQQEPVPEQGNLVKWKWFRWFDEAPALNGKDMIVQSWDTASKAGELNDYSVCTTWHAKGNAFYLLDVFRERLEYPELKRAVIQEARAYAAKTILIEDTAAGTALIADLKSERIPHDVIAVPVKADKIIRLSTQTATIEGGRVYLPGAASWLEEFRQEMMAFPQSRHDDQVDSFSQFLNWIGEFQRRGVARTAQVIGMF